MSNNPIPPVLPPVGDEPDDDGMQNADAQAVEGHDTDPTARDDDRPLDPDLDDDQVDSAEADARAATEGTMAGDADDAV